MEKLNIKKKIINKNKIKTKKQTQKKAGFKAVLKVPRQFPLG